MSLLAPVRAVVLVSCLLLSCLLGACKLSAGGEASDAATPEDSGPEATSPGDDATSSGAVTVEAPTDAAFPGEASIPAACAGSDAGIPPYGSPAGAIVTGAGVSATICTGVDVYLSSFIAPANRLLLELDSAGAASFQSPAGVTSGSLTLTVSIGTEPGVYTSAESAACGFVGFTYTADAPVTFEATASSNCIDPQNVAGSWAVSLTSLTPYPSTTQGTYYVPHGELVATLPAEDDAGAGTVTVALAF